VLAALQGRGSDLWIHICGNTRHILPLLRDLPFEGFEVDTRVEMTEARRLLGGRIALKGNLDTTYLLQRTPEEVHAACRAILASGPFSTGVVLSPGCGVPRMTPRENLRAMMRACEDHSCA
jgi:uroporphyrinogen-III decarboxylase